MIINALYECYERLLTDPGSGVSPPGYSKAKVSYALNISHKGELLNVIDLRVMKGKKLSSRDIDVPEQVKRASGIAPNFLCDNCVYVLGIGYIGKEKDSKWIMKRFEAFRRRQHEILDGVDDIGAQALLRFLDDWDPTKAVEHPLLREHLDGLADGGNIVFMLKGEHGYLHERPALRAAWEYHRSNSDSDRIGQCLVTGKRAPLARLHPSIKGVTGAQPSGASLVSFNLNAFTSYGKEQSYNSPVAVEAAFAYTTALNYLLASGRHRLRIGDTTTVFWAERIGSGIEEDFFAELFDPAWDTGKRDNKDDKPKRDPKTTGLVRDVLTRIREHKPVRDVMKEVDPDARFYILGLAPNASRLSVRFWHVDTFGSLTEKIGRHYSDMAIEKNWDTDPDFIPLWQILKETAPLGDMERVSPLLAGALTRAILLGLPYPQSLFTAMLSRVRADQTVNYVRAAVVKACLIRNYKHLDESKKEVVESMSLKEDNLNLPYRLGRLFALLEKVQQDANPGINATIRDRYFGAASATPRAVFPLLLRLSQHHISKAEYGFVTDKKIEEIMIGIDNFPSHLNLEEQGLFVLGYYHQRNALYKKSN
ncbi:CRISPR-associated protein, Csd1 family [Desulfotomaculum nigrificans CO-1-SRB]|uniref:CRISPR-associated protein, Csd1 family n=1 Tax=Desulfotomaculum nigrificans (strain DSM 14880 / VKM B-2319 / CO-1-SRB) TaxID=868595 RepID=F6B7Q6_DESCC|nr:type I-C CRISPR-associated protein Cas8c/Csd1 [Desulfotomaculum nigrificans]AEF93428.1 CRISPR-associated protein, Csd1 family [Desulfotomaculum nigrificans CO-1-SRB]